MHKVLDNPKAGDADLIHQVLLPARSQRAWLVQENLVAFAVLRGFRLSGPRKIIEIQTPPISRGNHSLLPQPVEGARILSTFLRGGGGRGS